MLYVFHLANHPFWPCKSAQQGLHEHPQQAAALSSSLSRNLSIEIMGASNHCCKQFSSSESIGNIVSMSYTSTQKVNKVFLSKFAGLLTIHDVILSDRTA